MLEQHVDGGAHAVNAGDVQYAWLIALGRVRQDDLVLGDVIRRSDIPRAEQRGAEQLEALFFYINDPDRHRPEEPLVRVGAEKIDMLDRDRKRAERLDRIE